MSVRRVIIGRFGKAGKQGAFFKSKVLSRFAKISPGGGLDAITSVAVINLIEVYLENFIFGKDQFQTNGQNGFFYFSGDVPVAGEKQCFG